MGLSVPVKGSAAVHVTVTVRVFGLRDTRSRPSTVALSDAPVSLLSTWKLAVVELPMKLSVGSWVSGSVIITTTVSNTPCILVPVLVIMCPSTGMSSTRIGGAGKGPGPGPEEGGLGPGVGRGAPHAAKAVTPLN